MLSIYLSMKVNAKLGVMIQEDFKILNYKLSERIDEIIKIVYDRHE